MLIPFNGSDCTRSIVECDDPAGGRYGLHTPSWHAVPIGPARAADDFGHWGFLVVADRVGRSRRRYCNEECSEGQTIFHQRSDLF